MTSEPDDSVLDAGLRAAFSPDAESDPPDRDDIFATLGDTLGAASRILLRDVPDELTPFIKPCDESTAGAIHRNHRYQTVGEIARGGVGVVLKARDVNLGRDIAMKVLRQDHVGSPTMVRRFVEEAQISGQLQHPGILPVYELGVHADRVPYFTMKLVKGQTLAAMLQHRKDLAADRQRFVTIFQHVCQTVAFAHAKGVIHRDLKPSNVMVGSFGEVQVVDWGLAKVLRQGGADDDDRAASAEETMIETERTGSEMAASVVGSVMGTPAYMPPEQARGDVAALDERSDVFALGAMLCEILTGKPPYVGEKMDVLLRASAAELNDALLRLDDCGADEELIVIARTCLAPSPAARPSDARAVAEAVTRYLESFEGRARALEVNAAEAAEKARGERRARRLTLALAATVCASLAVAGGGWAWVQQSQRARETQNTKQLNEAIDTAARALGEAKAAPAGRPATWSAAHAAAGQVEQLLGLEDIGTDARNRASELLAEMKRAETGRQLVERLEESVVIGATHEDKDSWLWMSEQLRGAFREYGIDVEMLANDEIVARIRQSPLSVQLTDALELWIATEFHLVILRAARYEIPQLLQKVEMLYAADPDPFRTKLRKLIYTGRPDLEELRALAASVPFETLLPRTLSWLASAFAISGDFEGCNDVFRRAVMLHPDDFMLNFDHAYHLVMGPKKRWEEAIRAYNRAIAIRPRTGGVWRALGNALRETGDLHGSLDALNRSIAIQPNHAPTYIDLGLTLEKLNRADGAIDAYRQSLHLKPEQPKAYGHLGHALKANGQLAEALEAYRKCHELSRSDPTWKEPSDQWIRECEEALQPAAPASGRP